MGASFSRLSAVAVPLEEDDIDSGRIFPSRYLRKPRSAGYAAFLFHDSRFDAHGAERPDFVMNRPEYAGAGILVTGANFGCGSSRESAVYALWDAGYRCVIAPSYGEIFRINCFRSGLLPIAMAPAAVRNLQLQLRQAPGASIQVDLAAQTVTGPDQYEFGFDIEADRKGRLLRGEDEFVLAIRQLERIDDFEAGYRMRYPWHAEFQADE